MNGLDDIYDKIKSLQRMSINYEIFAKKDLASKHEHLVL